MRRIPGLGRGGGTPVAQDRGCLALALTLLVDQVLERDGIEVLDHLLVERRPQLVGHAMAVQVLGAVAGTLATALRRIDRLVDRDDDVGRGHLFRAPREVIPAARTAYALDDLVPAQLAKQ